MLRYKIICLSLLALGFSACKKDPNQNQKGQPETFKETPVQGTATILVDETVFPVVEDAQLVFESIYSNAKLNLVTKPQNEVFNDLVKDQERIGIIARDLTEQEIAYFKSVPVTPVRTPIATDAIAFIAPKTAKDSVISYSEIEKILKGEPSAYKLYFDNSNSSTMQSLLDLYGLDKAVTTNIFAAKSNAEVIKNTANTVDAIGIVGVNWLTQPGKLAPQVDKLKVLGIEKDGKISKPNQTEIMDKTYPFTRDIYLINIQGKTGLGMGFASYIAGQDGQRIILKAGLVPSYPPTREIQIIK
ncbi:substrate-binding domain-containing protein [Flavobacterium agricola]|uniref:Substrate-binding domain-containing protein n=1 Tax=Flavobacterium agricola TaxID=2870839 RepID=A0ABY6LYK5_9FLAO|nr:substrate-binding domain-containing protein [Flavobacterium agricola]UYW00627.1 substrate-binding domain-containing protein [Flavobacterium agricola]